MDKRLNELLDKDISRFKEIISYKNKMIKENNDYKFYKNVAEADEQDPNQQNTNQSPDDMGNQPTQNMGGNPNGMDSNTPNDMGTQPGGDEMDGGEPEQMNPEDDGMGDTNTDMGAPDDMGNPEEGGMGDDTEVDITDLINNSNEIKLSVQNVLDNVQANTQQFGALANRVNTIESGLSKMDAVIGKLGELAKQVALMRPPTEAERREAVAKESYPYNISIEDYQKGKGAKNQTQLEEDPKMSMMKNIMQGYNDSKIKDSFYSPQEDPLNNF